MEINGDDGDGGGMEREFGRSDFFAGQKRRAVQTRSQQLLELHLNYI